MDPCAFNPQVRNSGEVAMVERICAGQSQLYLSLIEPYERAVFVSAYCILQSEADAEEVAFEAIRNGFIRLPALRAEEHFGVWLIHIAVQEARMRPVTTVVTTVIPVMGSATTMDGGGRGRHLHSKRFF